MIPSRIFCDRYQFFPQHLEVRGQSWRNDVTSSNANAEMKSMRSAKIWLTYVVIRWAGFRFDKGRSLFGCDSVMNPSRRWRSGSADYVPSVIMESADVGLLVGRLSKKVCLALVAFEATTIPSPKVCSLISGPRKILITRRSKPLRGRFGCSPVATFLQNGLGPSNFSEKTSKNPHSLVGTFVVSSDNMFVPKVVRR